MLATTQKRATFEATLATSATTPKQMAVCPPDGRLQYSIASSQAWENHLCEFIWLNI